MVWPILGASTPAAPSGSNSGGWKRASGRPPVSLPAVRRSSKPSPVPELDSLDLPNEVLCSLDQGLVRLLILPNGGVSVVNVESPSLFHE